MLWQYLTLFAIVGASVLFGINNSAKSIKSVGPEFERKMFEKIETFARNYANKEALSLINVGSFPELRDNQVIQDSTYFGFWLAGNSNIELNECRIKTTHLLKNFWQLVHEEPLAKDCLKDYLKYDKTNRDQPLGIEHIGIKIAYWTEENNRPLFPYIAQAHFFNSKFHYYQADPKTQSLYLIYEESYADAVANLGIKE